MATSRAQCRACRREVPPDHRGPCPHCGAEKGLDLMITPPAAELRFMTAGPIVIQTAKWWVWHPGYLTIVILATFGSVVSCLVPGWGIVAGLVCTIIATFTGFRAGVQHHKETIG